MQVVVSRRPFGTEPGNFDQIYVQLSLLLGKSRQWCHIFVIGDEENAEALRYKPREDIPAGVNLMIFTAIFNFGRLSPIRERFG